MQNMLIGGVECDRHFDSLVGSDSGMNWSLNGSKIQAPSLVFNLQISKSLDAFRATHQWFN